MRPETATKLAYGAMAVAFTGLGVYSLYRARTRVGESIWVAVGYLILGAGWMVLLVRASRSSGV